MRHRNIIFVLPVFVFLSMVIPHSLLAGEPGKLIMDAVGRGLSIREEYSLDKPEERRKCEQRIWAELSPIFDFEEMSKRALGLYWKQRSPEGKKEFAELFTNLLKNTYLGRACASSGEKIIYRGEKQESNYASVQTKIITNTGAEAVADYRLFKNEGKWRIYDVIIEGVSFINNYRSQFYSVLSRYSYEDLVQKLKERGKD